MERLGDGPVGQVPTPGQGRYTVPRLSVSRPGGNGPCLLRMEPDRQAPGGTRQSTGTSHAAVAGRWKYGLQPANALLEGLQDDLVPEAAANLAGANAQERHRPRSSVFYARPDPLDVTELAS